MLGFEKRLLRVLYTIALLYTGILMFPAMDSTNTILMMFFGLALGIAIFVEIAFRVIGED